MKTASLLENVKTWTKIQVVCVAENNLGKNLLAKFLKMNSLYRSYSSHRHKDRGLYLSVVGCDDTCSGI
jgi:hypothetical protein